MNKKALSTQALFFFFMAAIFVYLIIFGFQKIFLVQDHLSEEEHRELIKKLQEDLNYCNDPLNKGNKKLIEYNSPKFDFFCVVGNPIDLDESDSFEKILYEISTAGDNVIVFKTTGSLPRVIDSLSIGLDKGTGNICFGLEEKEYIECS